MRKLGLSEEEIAELLESDKRIDKGEKLFSLTPEQEKASKQARQAKAPTVYKLDNSQGKRSKKVDNDKKFLIETLVSSIIGTEKVDKTTIDITNSEREFIFYFNDRKYKVTLACPRS